MPALVRAFPSISPWNIRDLTIGDYSRLLDLLNDEAKAMKAAEAKGGVGGR
jgi:hypothetical protein